MSGLLPLEERQARVRAVLSLPFTMTHLAVAEATGISRETVRRIRFGLDLCDIYPEMPRLDPLTASARCWQCVHWQCRADRPGWDAPEPGDKAGRCLLGIPECRSEGHVWARGCGAFHRAP